MAPEVLQVKGTRRGMDWVNKICNFLCRNPSFVPLIWKFLWQGSFVLTNSSLFNKFTLRESLSTITFDFSNKNQ